MQIKNKNIDLLNIINENEYIIKKSNIKKLKIKDSKKMNVYILFSHIEEMEISNSNVSIYSIDADFSNSNIYIKKSKVSFFYFDLKNESYNRKITFNLNNIKSSLDIDGFTTNSLNFDKSLNININHKEEKTYSNASFFSLVKENSCFILEINCNVFELAKNSSTHQKSKSIIIGSKSKSSILPKLDVKNKNISASHSSSIGKISEEDLFYLQSRGLNKKQAADFIVKGYFNSFIEKLKNNDIKEYVKEEYSWMLIK